LSFDLPPNLHEPAAIAFFVALVAGICAFPFYIKWLKSHQIGQILREEGPASHAHKANTPTMGGICFIAVTVVVFLAFAFWPGGIDPLSGFTVFTGFLCGLVGLSDDLAKLAKKKNAGLSASTRLKLEAIIGASFGILAFLFMSKASHTLPAIMLPKELGIYALRFLNVHYFDLGIPAIPVPITLFALISTFLVAATTNAVNLHDGMDGLAGGTSLIVFLTLAIMLTHSGQHQLALAAATAAGSIAAYLVFNRYPAKVMMGDTGSLFIGGLMAALVLAGGLLFWFIPLSLIYILEAISVMLQFSYFRLTKPYTPEKPMNPVALFLFKLTKKLPGEGKRIFRMAPLHHHFEAVFAEKGVREWQVVAGFWIIQLILAGLTLAAFFVF
jgi:phospho-N-acetylmuramoyl-pentapeptide-transferase